MRPWARARGAMTLLGPGGELFKQRLRDALLDEGNEFLWQIAEINFARARSAVGWYNAGDLERCEYTNYELWTFFDRTDLWSRTTWWLGEDEVQNPLETWL
jgi:hypothetical protein